MSASGWISIILSVAEDVGLTQFAVLYMNLAWSFAVITQ